MIEPERYELSEARRYRFELERRDFMRLFGGGLVVMVAASDLLAQESGRARPQGRADTPDLAAWLHIDESGVCDACRFAELKEQIDLAGRTGRLHAFHICDWKTPTTDLLNDRGLMGEGCIDLVGFRHGIEAAGFTGPYEVEVQNEVLSTLPPEQMVARVVTSFRQFVQAEA